jgi:hypothetical protein
MNKIVTLIISSILITGCIQTPDRKKLTINDSQLQDYKLLNRFITKDSMVLGNLYGKPINDSIYSDFLIIKKSKNSNVLIYSISKTDFRNSLGKENIPINSENFFGYFVLVLTKKDMALEPRFIIVR